MKLSPWKWYSSCTKLTPFPLQDNSHSTIFYTCWTENINIMWVCVCLCVCFNNLSFHSHSMEQRKFYQICRGEKGDYNSLYVYHIIKWWAWAFKVERGKIRLIPHSHYTRYKFIEPAKWKWIKEILCMIEEEEKSD